MKLRPYIVIAAMAALAASPVAQADAPRLDTKPAANSHQDSSKPKLMQPENIDGSSVDRSVHNDSVGLIQAYQKAEASGSAPDRDKAIAAFEAFHAKNPKNLIGITWLGYGYLQTGQDSKAIEVLTPAIGKSKDPVVNAHNDQNIGVAYYAQAQYPEAVDALQRSLSGLPDEGKTYSLIGSAELLQKHYDPAIAALVKAKSLGQSGKAVDTDLGVAYQKAGRTDEAMSVFAGLDKDGNASPTIQAWMGYTYLTESKYDDSISLLTKAHSADAANVAVTEDLATAYMKRGSAGDDSAALPLFRQVASNNPQQVYLNIGTIELRQKNYDAARSDLQKSIDAGSTAAAENNLGQALVGLGQHEEASKHFAKASDLEPANAAYASNAGNCFVHCNKPDMARTYVDRAVKDGSTDVATSITAADLSDPVEGLKKLEAIKEKAKDRADYWFDLGVLRAKNGDKDGAAEAYKKCLEISPDDMNAHTNLGVIDFSQGRYQDAAENFRPAAQASGATVQAKVNYAAALAKTGNGAEAVRMWQEILHAEPARHDVRDMLAASLWDAKKPKEAAEQWRIVLNSHPADAQALNGVGLVALLDGKNQDAAGFFRRAITSDNAMKEAYLGLATSQERLNHLSDAIATLRRTVKLFPDYEDAQRMLKRLHSAG